MPTNRETLSWLFDTGKIKLRRGAIFDTAPAPLPDALGFDRVEAMMLGLAIGDALGNTSEGQLPARRSEEHGEIRDYVPNRYADFRPVGVPTDDTQVAFWTLEQMIADGGFVPQHVAEHLASRQVFGIGSAVREAMQRTQEGGAWHEAGPESAGNGALMRIAPMLIPHLRTATSDLWVDIALSAMITHNDSGSISACLAFIGILWDLLRFDSAPDPGWWVQRYVEIAHDLEVTAYRPRGGEFAGFQGPVWRFVEERLPEALEADRPAAEACSAWYSGAFILETVPSALYMLMRHAGDPEEAIMRAVNDTRDSDTIGAIVGAAIGALHGMDALPKRWRDGLLGRTAADDDGRIYDLLTDARGLWWV
jgi:ADP-ribosyl-[dinitrogen reductase] hydrolase